MAKVGEGAPYVVEAIKATRQHDAPAVLAIENAAVSAVAADLDAVINKYYDHDWCFVAAAMEITAAALKSHLDPPFLKIMDSLTHRTVATSTIIPHPPRGGNAPDSVKGGAK